MLRITAAALRNGAGHVDTVEIDPVIYSLGERQHPEQDSLKLSRCTIQCFTSRIDQRPSGGLYGMVKTVPGGDASNRFAYSWKCRSANARSRHSLTIPKGMRHRAIAATDRTPFGLPLLTSQASVHAKASIGKNQYRRPFLRKLQPLPGWNLADRRRGKERRAQDQNCEAHQQLEF